MYKFGFFGSVVMNHEKYARAQSVVIDRTDAASTGRYQSGEPLRIVKYKSQCALSEWSRPDRPPRGCDSTASQSFLLGYKMTSRWRENAPHETKHGGISMQ
eukprot:scaffold172427_cov13-Prasinocladus_malaysianus.AAC.1